MNLSGVIDGLTRCSLSANLERHSASMERGAYGRRRARTLDWLEFTGTLAWRACADYRRVAVRRARIGDAVAPLLDLDRSSFVADDPYTREFAECVMLRAFIAVASAHETLTDARRLQVLQRICSLDIATEEKMFLMEEIQRPLAASDLARYGVSVEAATSLYTSALVAADLASPAVMLWLTELADALDLPPALAATLHRAVEQVGDQLPDTRRSALASHQATV